MKDRRLLLRSRLNEVNIINVVNMYELLIFTIINKIT